MHVASGRSLHWLKKENNSRFLLTRQNELPRRRRCLWLPLTPLRIISNNITLEATAADLAFSRHIPPTAVLRLWIGCAAYAAHCCSSSGPLAKGHIDKEAEPIICVSSRGSTQQTSIVELHVMLGPFHRSHKRLEIIEILLIVLSLSLIFRYCKESATNLQNKAVLQLHFTRLDKECLIREKQT